MLYEDYDARAKAVAACVDEGKYTEALKLLQSLIDSDLSDIDKSMMSVNMAVVYEKMEQPERALEWYDRGIMYEAIYLRCLVAEHKAAYLFKLKRFAECLSIYEELLPQGFQTEVDKLRMRQNIESAKNAMR